MILTCPQCATRYQADAAKFQPAGRNVRCAKCGHLWHQDAPPPAEPDLTADEIPAPEPLPAPPPPAPVPMVAPRPAALAPNPVIAREAPPPPAAIAAPAAPRAPSRWPARLGLGAGWAALIAVILLIGWSALSFRQQIATIWPQSASLYAAMGMKPNASGIDIQDVAYKRDREGSQSVLSVTGRLTNTGSRELPVPQIRVALIDGDNREIYHWAFLPGVMTLHPGETKAFSTRLTNPPEAARHFELRFAREGE